MILDICSIVIVLQFLFLSLIHVPVISEHNCYYTMSKECGMWNDSGSKGCFKSTLYLVLGLGGGGCMDSQAF